MLPLNNTPKDSSFVTPYPVTKPVASQKKAVVPATSGDSYTSGKHPEVATKKAEKKSSFLPWGIGLVGLLGVGTIVGIALKKGWKPWGERPTIPSTLEGKPSTLEENLIHGKPPTPSENPPTHPIEPTEPIPSVPVVKPPPTASERLGISAEQRQQQEALALDAIEKYKERDPLIFSDLGLHGYTRAQIPIINISTKNSIRKSTDYYNVALNLGVLDDMGGNIITNVNCTKIPKSVRVEKKDYPSFRGKNPLTPIDVFGSDHNTGFHIERTKEETPRFYMTIRLHEPYSNGGRAYNTSFVLSNENPTVMKDLLRLLLVDNLENFKSKEKATELKLLWKGDLETCGLDMFLSSLQHSLKKSVEALRKNPEYAQFSDKHPDDPQFLDALWSELLPDDSPIKTWLSKNDFSIDQAFDSIESGDLRRVITPKRGESSRHQNYLE